MKFRLRMNSWVTRISVMFFALALPLHQAMAQTPISIAPSAGTVSSTLPPTGNTNGAIAFIQGIYTRVFNILTLVAGILAVFYIIFQGYRLITSNGDPTIVKTAKAGILNTVIGVVIVVTAILLIQLATKVGGDLAGL